MELTIAILLPVFLAVVGFIYWLIQDTLNQAHKRRIEFTRYHSDANGNYPFYFDPATNTFIATDPGNPAFPITYHFTETTRPGRTINYRPPTVVNDYRAQVEPTKALENEAEPLELVDGSNQFDPYKELARLKGNTSKNKAFAAIGVAKGSGQLYEELSRYWNSLEN